MPTPTRALTNNYRDCQLIKLDPNEASSPLVVAQEGYRPHDATFQMRLYYLQHDGYWIDEVARSTRPDSEIAEIVFDTAADALKVLSTLFGPPMVREVSVTEADVQTYLSKAKAVSSPQALARDFLSRYRTAKGK